MSHPSSPNPPSSHMMERSHCRMLIGNNNETLMDVCGQRQVFGFVSPRVWKLWLSEAKGVRPWLVSMAVTTTSGFKSICFVWRPFKSLSVIWQNKNFRARIKAINRTNHFYIVCKYCRILEGSCILRHEIVFCFWHHCSGMAWDFM